MSYLSTNYITIYISQSLVYFLSVLISILIIIILLFLTVLTLDDKNAIYSLFLISNMIGVYLNRLLDVTMRSAYNQLCQSMFISMKMNGFFLK